jgi:hypothetical protein
VGTGKPLLKQAASKSQVAAQASGSVSFFPDRWRCANHKQAQAKAIDTAEINPRRQSRRDSKMDASATATSKFLFLKKFIVFESFTGETEENKAKRLIDSRVPGKHNRAKAANGIDRFSFSTSKPALITARST